MADTDTDRQAAEPSSTETDQQQGGQAGSDTQQPDSPPWDRAEPELLTEGYEPTEQQAQLNETEMPASRVKEAQDD
jgi:hypothetical protein